MDITHVLPPKHIAQPFFFVVTSKLGIFITITPVIVVVVLPVSFTTSAVV